MSIRSALTQALISAGFDVTAAEEREEAEALLATESYDLVLTDLRLGDLSGFSGLQVLSDAAYRNGREASAGNDRICHTLSRVCRAGNGI